MTPKVIDIHSDTEPDFEELAEEYQGVIFKGGQGQLADVPRVQPTWSQQARDVGLGVGWYWVVDSRYKASRQVDEVWKWLKGDFGELGLWADVEKAVRSWSDVDYWATTYAGQQNVYNFMEGVREGDGKLPGFYSSPGFWNLVFEGIPTASKQWYAAAPLWIAQYPFVYLPGISHPKTFGLWPTWTFWQYREGPDINLFNGDLNEFEKRFGLSEPITPPVIPPTNGGGDMTYSYTSQYNMSLRPAPNTNNTAQSQLAAGVEAQGEELYIYTAPAGTSLIGDKWLHVTSILGTPVDYWVAVIHAGKVYGTLVGETPSGEIELTHTIEVYSDGSLVIDGIPYA